MAPMLAVNKSVCKNLLQNAVKSEQFIHIGQCNQSVAWFKDKTQHYTRHERRELKAIMKVYDQVKAMLVSKDYIRQINIRLKITPV